MTNTVSISSIKTLDIAKFADRKIELGSDIVSVEEPLEIRLVLDEGVGPKTQQVAVTMRTPGNDPELAAGFLFTEGVLSGARDIERIEVLKCNVVNVTLAKHVEVDPAIFSRHSFVASSCGVCGKKTIAAVRVRRLHKCNHGTPIVSGATVNGLSSTLRSFQSDFERTGGLHASCLFDAEGTFLNIKEDVGRHNALDKLLGEELIEGRVPLTERILLVSGRASFELVQKAAHAGIPILVAVGAPSSLAVQLAEECDMTLIGFARDGRFNIYAGSQRVQA